MAYIECKNAAFAYEGVNVIENLNFSVSEGDYLCVVGDNGSGKSTLIKGILDLIKPSEGEIVFGDGIKRNEIGYLPQKSVAQKDFPASVFEVVISGALNRMGFRPFYGKKEKEAAERVMELTEITHLKDKCFKDLSGGQQQRVLLSRALLATKKLLLLDEPVAGLDPTATMEMYETIARINEEGIAVIMVTHDLETAIAEATHVLRLKEKKAEFLSRAEYTVKYKCDCKVTKKIKPWI